MTADAHSILAAVGGFLSAVAKKKRNYRSSLRRRKFLTVCCSAKSAETCGLGASKRRSIGGQCRKCRTSKLIAVGEFLITPKKEPAPNFLIGSEILHFLDSAGPHRHGQRASAVFGLLRQIFRAKTYFCRGA